MRTCLKCKKEITGRKNKKFCNPKCQTRFNSNKRYQKIKNTPEYKALRKKIWGRWYKKNRLRFNKMANEASKKYQKRIRGERLNNNLCPNCGSKRDSKFLMCEPCRIKRR